MVTVDIPVDQLFSEVKIEGRACRPSASLVPHIFQVMMKSCCLRILIF